MHKGFKKHARFAASALVSAICLSPPMYTNAASPSQVQMTVGEPRQIPIGIAKYADVMSSNAAIVRIGTNGTADLTNGVSVFPKRVGDARVVAKLFGFIPWKSVDVHVLPRQMVYVGGQSIGVALHVNGTMVVGREPGNSSELELGDVIRMVNGHKVSSSADLKRWTPLSAKSVKLVVRRGLPDAPLTLPIKVPLNSHHQLGVYVRDKTVGIGTLTFYDPVHHTYGALGHIITDADTGRPIEGWGSVYDSDITGIVKGKPGQPGEKLGRFAAGTPRLGDISQNTDFGLFGHMDEMPAHLYRKTEVLVALPSQVHPGSARMLTVLHGHQVESFSVRIENVARQNHPTTRSMIIRVTDPRLLTGTGGIVQGMSGSPILQDGRLVGAVTHVFMSDSTRGYGIFSAWMATMSDIKAKETNEPIVQSGDIVAV